MFVNYAHRGASHYAPQNTRTSFLLGVEMQANGIELDLQKTKDGQIVIFHDETIEQLSNGTGRIADYTYEELLKLDFGSWKDAKFAGEPIMLFEDFAKEFLPMDLTFAIELKVGNIEKETLAIIRRYKTHENIYVSSFQYDYLKTMRALDADIKLSWLVYDITEENIQKLLDIGASQICPSAKHVTPEGISQARAAGLGVRLWDVTDEEIMKAVYPLDTDGMTVNFPDKLKALTDRDGRV